MATITIGKDEVGVGIEGRSEYPVRLELATSKLSSCFGIKARDAHNLISFIEKYPTEVLTIESTRGTLEVQFVEAETLGIENMDDQMLMVLAKNSFEELHRLLTLTVPKLQEFIEKNWHELARKQTDDNLRGVFE
jgi:hypothetical protein